MPFTVPSIQTLIDRVRSDIRSRLPGADPTTRRSFLGVISRTHSGAMHGLYAYQKWLSEQFMPDTAETENLERWCSIYGIARLPAARSVGSVDFTGNSSILIPVGTLIQSSDGTEYKTDVNITTAGGAATVAAVAVDGGEAGDLDPGANLTLVNPISGINSAAVTSTGFSDGADRETDDALRARLLDRIRQPPHGGAFFDYVKWAKEVSGVDKAWVNEHEFGIGTVAVRFVTENNGIPSAGLVQLVSDYIDERRQVTAFVTVLAPVSAPIDMTIKIDPNNTTVQAAITAELNDLLTREAEPGGTILLSRIQEAISIAAGESDHTLVTPTANVTHTSSQLPTLGTITYQDL